MAMWLHDRVCGDGAVPTAVANVAFETTEEQLRAVLCEVGPVVSLK